MGTVCMLPREPAVKSLALPLSGVGMLAACLSLSGALAQVPISEPDIFKGADLALGRQLIEAHQCAACHARKFGGDGSAVYRPMERVQTAGALRGMVEQCNTELNLGMFPEEVSAVAAVLNRQYYRFK